MSPDDEERTGGSIERVAIIAVLMILAGCLIAFVLLSAESTTVKVPLCPNCGQKMWILGSMEVDTYKGANCVRANYVCPNEDCRLFLWINGSAYVKETPSKKDWSAMIELARRANVRDDTLKNLKWVPKD